MSSEMPDQYGNDAVSASEAAGAKSLGLLCGNEEQESLYCAACLLGLKKCRFIKDTLNSLQLKMRGVVDEFKSSYKKNPQAISARFKDELSGLIGSYKELKKSFDELSRCQHHTAALSQSAQEIISVLDMGELLNLIMDRVIKLMNAERGFLMLKDEHTGQLKFKVARNMDEELQDSRHFTISSSIASKVASDGKPIHTTDALADDRFAEAASIVDFNIRSVLCVPLTTKNHVVGVVYIDNRMVAGAFTEDSLRLLTSFANEAAIAIENSRLYENIKRETRIRTNLQRYLSPNVVEDMVKNKEEMRLGGKRVECTTLFSDICGFTAMSENMSPEEVVQILNEYFTSMTEIIFEHKGTLDKFIGDAIMAVFGAPIASQDSAGEAVNAAVAMLNKLNLLRTEWAALGKKQLQIRIGINTGEVVSGNIGSPQRMDFTVIGDNVNIASRLCSAAAPGTILISENTFNKTKHLVEAQRLEPIKVKGKTEPLQTFQVAGLKGGPKEKPAEKRRCTRKEVSIFTIYKIEGQPGVHQGMIHNISEGGLLLTTRTHLAPGVQIILNFKLPDDDAEIEARCQIAKTLTMSDEEKHIYYRCGSKFTNISQQTLSKIRVF